MKAKILSLITIICASLTMHSCVEGLVFDEFVSITDAQWSTDSLAVFRTDIADTIASYDVSVVVRNDNNYAYANLWLFIDVIDALGNARRDTIECLLAEPDGAWRGSGWGSLYTVRCPYLSDVRFATSGAHTFRLTQGMRDISLSGIHDIGLVIEKHVDGQK